MEMPVEIRETTVESFDLKAAAANLRGGSEYASNGRSAQTLAKGADLRLTLVVIGEGAELGEHSAPGSATISVIEGEVTFRSEAGERALIAGSSLVFGAGVRHSVVGVRDAAFLLTIVKHP